MDLSHPMITALHTVNTINSRMPVSRERENRPCAALMYKAEGRTVYRTGGREFVSDPLHLIYLPRGISYSFSIEETGHCTGIELDFAGEPDALPRSFPVRNPEELSNLCSRLLRTWNQRGTGSFSACLSEIYRILSVTECAVDTDYASRKKEVLIRPALTYMLSHVDDPALDNARLAREAGLSEVYFRRIFAGCHRMPPGQYLLQLRIKRAKELLSGDYASVEDVALSVGYAGSPHFCKIFRREVGMTPSEFARRSKEGDGGERGMAL